MSFIEGAPLSASRRSHLDSCGACISRMQEVRIAHDSLSTADSSIPEPDWNDFRSSVRLELLSRSVQRESAVRRWTGWAIRPAMAWAFSMLIVIGLGAGGFLWHLSKDQQQPVSDVPSGNPPATVSMDERAIEDERAVWAPGAFEAVALLEDEQASKLVHLLLTAPQSKPELNRQ